MKKQKGFSLIELLIVVGIIGALTAIAVPAYQEHSKKSEATAGVAVLKSLLTNIDLHIQADDFPADNEWDSIGASKTMSALGEMTLTPADDAKYGELKLVFGDESVLKTKTVTYTKTANGWTCEQNSDVKIKSCAAPASSNSTPQTPPQGG